VVGDNGAGKTNLLESVHVAGQGFSPRTRSDADVIRFGNTAARTAISGGENGLRFRSEVTLRAGEGKRAVLNGAPLRAAEQLRNKLRMLVFTPDRLAVVKGGPSVRRAYFDRVLGRLARAQAALPAEYGAALAQRNAALRRVAAGLSSAEAVSPWTERVAALGERLCEARTKTVELLGGSFRERAAELGLADTRLDYVGEPPSRAALDERLERDLRRGWTGLGPHLHDFAVVVGGRDLRAFGSQGEQRTAVLSLLLAECDASIQQRGSPPLLLLDDVLSELDGRRRRVLADRLTTSGQSLVTATVTGALPATPCQVVEVTPGRARTA
jgi:DNA replication and repair protein RecF